MSTEHPTELQPWGAPPAADPSPAKSRWSGRKTVAAVAVAVVIAGGGGAAIWAATSNGGGSSVGPSGQVSGGQGPGGQGAPPDGVPRGGVDALLPGVLHGEVVLSDRSTGLLQVGTINAVSASSISVTSTDGYAMTYTIDSSTMINNGGTASELTANAPVVVVARKNDGVARSIVEPAAGRGGPGPGPGQRPQQGPPS